MGPCATPAACEVPCVRLACYVPFLTVGPRKPNTRYARPGLRSCDGAFHPARQAPPRGAPRGRNAPFGAPPAQIPACSFPAPGSSLLLTRSHDTCTRHAPSLYCGYRLHGLPVILTAHIGIPQDATAPSPSPCTQLSRARSTTRRSDSPGLIYPFARLLALPSHTPALAGEVQGPPTFSACLSSHATLLDPGGCPVLLPQRSFNPSACPRRRGRLLLVLDVQSFRYVEAVAHRI